MHTFSGANELYKIYGFLLHTSSALARNRWLDCHRGRARACDLEEPVSTVARWDAPARLVWHCRRGDGPVGVQYMVRRRSRHSSARRNTDGHAVRLATRDGRHGRDDRSGGGRTGCLVARRARDLLTVRGIARRRIVAATESYPGFDSAKSLRLHPRSRFPYVGMRRRNSVLGRTAAANRACRWRAYYPGWIYARCLPARSRRGLVHRRVHHPDHRLPTYLDHYVRRPALSARSWAARLNVASIQTHPFQTLFRIKVHGRTCVEAGHRWRVVKEFNIRWNSRSLSGILRACCLFSA